jgi:adenylate kinase family enzyme
VRRVSVIGTSGSGKSTLGRELAGILAVPYLELDSIFHQPGWSPLPQPDFREAARAAAAGDGWVIDGNYSAVQPVVWERADTVIWLDISRPTVMRRLAWRTFRRAATREQLWNGNRERWRNFFSLDPEQSIIAWAWARHAEYRARYNAASRDPASAHLTFIRLATPRDARHFLTSTRARAALP